VRRLQLRSSSNIPGLETSSKPWVADSVSAIVKKRRPPRKGLRGSFDLLAFFKHPVARKR